MCNTHTHNCCNRLCLQRRNYYKMYWFHDLSAFDDGDIESAWTIILHSKLRQFFLGPLYASVLFCSSSVQVLDDVTIFYGFTSKQFSKLFH